MRLFIILSLIFSSSIALADNRTTVVEDLLWSTQQAFESEEIQTKKEAISKLFPTREQFLAVFGQDAADIYSMIEAYQTKMIDNVEQVAGEFTRLGSLLSVKVIPLTADDGPEELKLLELIPPGIGVYRVSRKFERGHSGSSTYFVLKDETCVWIRGAEVIPQMLEEVKSK